METSKINLSHERKTQKLYIIFYFTASKRPIFQDLFAADLSLANFCEEPLRVIGLAF